MPTVRAQIFWPEAWWRLIDFRIGIIPVPIFVLLIGLIAALVAVGEIKSDGPTMIVVLALGGFTCAEIGKRIPVLRSIGAGAIFATFIPSALAYYYLIPDQVGKLVAAFPFANIITIVSTVVAIMATGFVVGGPMKMYPIETAIVNACHSGQGGTGDVAILTAAANRMQLVPFAQIATSSAER
jgi:Na+/citrate or Na+/malate symporter